MSDYLAVAGAGLLYLFPFGLACALARLALAMIRLAREIVNFQPVA